MSLSISEASRTLTAVASTPNAGDCHQNDQTTGPSSCSSAICRHRVDFRGTEP
jgi:hypothetical protein